MRRYLLPLLALLVLLPILSSSSAHAAIRARLGDVTGDGRVAVDDAVKVLRIALGLMTPSSTDVIIGDVQPYPGTGDRRIGDGVLTIADALAILRYSLGLMTDDQFGANEVVVGVLPGRTVLGPNQQQQFNLLLIGPAPDSVQWSVVGSAGGFINESGVYTAPSNIPSVSNVTVQADVGPASGTALVVLDPEGPPPPPPGLG